MNNFTDITGQIPSDVLGNTVAFMNSNIGVFKPRVFLSDTFMTNNEYHFILPSTTPPPTMIGKKEYDLSAGKLIIFNPETEVKSKFTLKCKEYINIIIKKEYIQKVASELGIAKNIIFSHLQNPCSARMRQVIHDLGQEAGQTDYLSPLLIEGLSLQFVGLLLREMKGSHSNIKTRYDPSFTDLVYDAIDYMKKNYHANISIGDICNAIYTTPWHFIRVFREKTGYTPHDYLMNIRIEHAKLLLAQYDYPISAVASMCGFINMAHFSSVFRCKVGQTPSDYKKELHTR